jgi:hypothetical protein
MKGNEAMAEQRYISQYLTHFVGRGKKEAEQYELLKTILKERKLKPSDNGEPVDNPNSISYGIKQPIGTNVDFNDLFFSMPVCLTDIPLGDLPLHIEQYSPFGMSFKKEYLLQYGVRPINYIPRNGSIFNNFSGTRETFNPVQMEYTEFFKMFYKLYDIYGKPDISGNANADAENFIPSYKEINKLTKKVLHFVLVHLLLYCKYWDYNSKSSPNEDFYLEREWRGLNVIPFELTEVKRIFIPSSCQSQFASDFPDYSGQVIFPDCFD